MAPDNSVPFKLIFLDEADALTPDAQGALGRIMEQYAGTCRFILSCNYSSKIIEPIQSRCAVFRFRPLAEDQILEMVQEVAEARLSLEDDGAAAVVHVAIGDLRRAITALQGRCLAIEQDHPGPRLRDHGHGPRRSCMHTSGAARRTASNQRGGRCTPSSTASGSLARTS